MYEFSIVYKGADHNVVMKVKSVHYNAGVVSVVHIDDSTEIINFAEVISYSFKKVATTTP